MSCASARPTQEAGAKPGAVLGAASGPVANACVMTAKVAAMRDEGVQRVTARRQVLSGPINCGSRTQGRWGSEKGGPHPRAHAPVRSCMMRCAAGDLSDGRFDQRRVNPNVTGQVIGDGSAGLPTREDRQRRDRVLAHEMRDACSGRGSMQCDVRLFMHWARLQPPRRDDQPLATSSSVNSTCSSSRLRFPRLKGCRYNSPTIERVQVQLSHG